MMCDSQYNAVCHALLLKEKNYHHAYSEVFQRSFLKDFHPEDFKQVQHERYADTLSL